VLYLCPKCGRLEFRVDKETKDYLISSSDEEQLAEFLDEYKKIKISHLEDDSCGFR
jgi:hypothetical protein